MSRMVFGYARVSTTDQNLERQLKQLREHIGDERFIYTDKASGKSFDRAAYNSLVGTEKNAPHLHEGDLLIVCSLDRLGRNYAEIRQQWEYITKKLGADIKVLDMPLLDTSVLPDTLDKRFIANLVLEILSYTAEKERENILKRQRQGIDAMPQRDGKKISMKTGQATGRPEMSYPDKWQDFYTAWQNGNITATDAMKRLGLKRTTFYKLAKKCAEDE